MSINKKLLLGVLILIIAILVFGLTVRWVIFQEKEVLQEKVLQLQEVREAEIERQLRELEELKKEIQPLLPEVRIEEQIRELEKLHQKIPLPTPEEIQKQLEELDKLRPT